MHPPQLQHEHSQYQVQEIFLGWVRRPQREFGPSDQPRYMEACGFYVPVDRGLEEPCHRRCGSYNRGKPAYKTKLSTYSPLTLPFLLRGYRGKIRNLCTYSDCVNEHHHEIIPWKEYMAEIRPMQRDPKSGRFIADS